jgi:N-acetyl-anhydromuramyl-L-alanine amidase AmpD
VLKKLLVVSCIAVFGLLWSAGCGGQSPFPANPNVDLAAGAEEEAAVAAPQELAHDTVDPALLKAAPEWQQSLMPLFQQASDAYAVPMDLLLTLAKAGSAFENRGTAATLEGGYGVMALRKNDMGGNSLELAAQLTGTTTDQLMADPAANILGAAAVLNAYAIEAGVDRAGGVEAWLPAVIKYAGLDEEDSKFFAYGIYEWIQLGFSVTNTYGEEFAVASRALETINLDSLIPPGMKKISIEDLEAGVNPDDIMASADKQSRAELDYPSATWDPAASCNYTATSSSKDTIIIHTIEGTAAGARSWFKNCASQVSAHYVVSEAGGVWQMVAEAYKAWHVGCLNSRAIGIENEGYASSSSHPNSLYNACGALCKNICGRRGIAKAHHTCPPGILGHKDANTCSCGGTHTDPGSGWNWNYFISQVNGGTSTWASTYHAQSYQSKMTAGDTAIVWAEFNNTGTNDWNHDEVYLGTSSPADRNSAFCTSGNWYNCHRPSEVDQSDVNNGGVGRFTFIMTAPATPGTYTEKFKLVTSGGTWFGSEITWTITVTAAGPDTAAPSVPGGLTVSSKSTSQIDLSWTASTDNVGVTGYKIYRNGTYLTTNTDTTYSNTGLAEGSTYTYQVTAIDHAANESGKSSSVGDTTWIIVDNAESGFTASTGWATSTSSSDKYGADYRWKSTAAVSDPAMWTFNIPTADNYQVYVWYSEGTNRSAAAPYIVAYNGGSTTVPVNQQTNGGQWNSIGTFNFAAGSNNVKLSCWAGSGYIVVGDAIRLIRR